MLRAYAGISGYNAPLQETEAARTDDYEPTYGELTFDGVNELVKRIGLRPSDQFIDIGCGIGKLVIQAALQSGAQCTGIELCRSRYDKAIRALHFCQTYHYIPNVRFIYADATTFSYNNATVVYMCSTCFSTNMILKIVEGLPLGCRVVLQTHPQEFKKVYDGENEGNGELAPQYSRVLEYSSFFNVPVTWTAEVPLYVYTVQSID